VLDQLSDKDSGLGSVRHLSHEDLEAYSTGRLAAGRSSACQTHLESCEACRAELEDLRAFQGELAGFSRPKPNPGEFGRRKRGGKLSLPLAASIAAILFAAVSTVFWLRHHEPRITRGSVRIPVAQPPVAQPAAPMQTNDTLATASTTIPRVAVRSTTPGADRAPGSASPSPAPPEANKGFALLGPVGTTISETRPEFSWQPLPGAIRYSVAIVDARLHPVQRSPALRTTVWRPRRPLRRGRTYLWQVTATLRGGSKVVASQPGILTETAGELSADERLVHFDRSVKSDNR
jgi:anti-sigma factor RsiW